METGNIVNEAGVVRDSLYLLNNFAPLPVVLQFAFSRRRMRKDTKHYWQKKEEFRRIVADSDFRNDWVSSKIRYWSYLFDNHNLYSKDELNILEIGSWEGLSALYFMTDLPNAHLTCVDTWEGSEEHNDNKENKLQKIGDEEKRFDKNLAAFKDRITKIKSSSLAYFAGDTPKSTFDIIHVDGSHHADDVISDALNSFARLKPGGFMVFDDYLWRYYPRSADNPAAAINCFLKLKMDQIEILMVSTQLFIRKIADN